MKRISIILALILFAQALHSQWLPDSIINDRNTVNRTGYNNARGLVPSGNDIYAVWIEMGYRIFLRAKVDSTWRPSEEVSVGSPGGIYGTSAYPSIAVHNNDVHVVWEDYRTADFEIFYRRFSNGWGTPINLSGDTAQSRSAVITITASNRRFLIWQDDRTGIYEIFCKIYEDGSWGSSERISNASLYAGSPTVVHHNETVYLVWEQMENNGYELYFAAHTGGAWSSPQRITDCEGLSLYPSLCTSPSGTIHLVFSDDRSGSFDIYYKQYSGGSWSPEILLTQGNAGEALYPQIACDPYGDLHLVWSGNSEGAYQIHYKKCVSSLWSADTLLSSSNALSSLPHIAATTDGSVHVMWYDWGEAPLFTSPHIRYRRYNATLSILSSAISTKITPGGVRLSASIPDRMLSLFRIASPFALPVTPCSAEGHTTFWYEALEPGDYAYTLQSRSGSITHYSPPIEVHIPEKPLPYSLQLFPNPFTASTTIRINGLMHTSVGMELKIYNIAGRLLRQISLLPYNASLGAQATWDGKDEGGRAVRAGIYFIHCTYDGNTLSRKVTKLP